MRKLGQLLDKFSLLVLGDVLSELQWLSVVPLILLYSIPILNHGIDFTGWLVPFSKVIDVEYLFVSSLIWHLNVIIQLPSSSCDHIGTLPVG